MTTIRLTTQMKDNIVADLLRHRFSEAAQQIVFDSASLAASIYNDVYSQEMRERMKALPEGWLPYSSTIKVELASNFVSFSFDGECYGDLSKVGGRDRKDNLGDLPPSRLFLSRDNNKCLKQYSATDLIALRYDDYENERADLLEKIKTARAAAIGALNSVTTIKRLKEVWPEIAPFVERYEIRPNQLPAISRPDLNGILGLPIEEKETAQ